MDGAAIVENSRSLDGQNTISNENAEKHKDEILEKQQSRLHIAQTTSSADHSRSDSYSSSLNTPPTDDALAELVPQLSRRGTINPDSPFFSGEKYLRMMITKAQEQGLRRRSAGVLF